MSSFTEALPFNPSIHAQPPSPNTGKHPHTGTPAHPLPLCDTRSASQRDSSTDLHHDCTSCRPHTFPQLSLNFLQQNLFTCSSLQLSQLTQALGLLPPHSVLSAGLLPSVLELSQAPPFSGQVDSLIRGTHICTAHTSQDYRQLQGTHGNSEG